MRPPILLTDLLSLLIPKNIQSREPIVPISGLGSSPCHCASTFLVVCVSFGPIIPFSPAPTNVAPTHEPGSRCGLLPGCGLSPASFGLALQEREQSVVPQFFISTLESARVALRHSAVSTRGYPLRSLHGYHRPAKVSQVFALPPPLSCVCLCYEQALLVGHAIPNCSS